MTENRRERRWTAPNLLSGIRLFGIAPLLWLAWGGSRRLFVGWLLFLILTDWIDGRLAVALDQRTELGARLDSTADALMYAAIALSFWWLLPDVLLDHRTWFLTMLGAFLLSSAVGLVRFGRMPSYHTRAAKAGWLLVGVVTVWTVWTGDDAAVPWALAWVVLTNLEALLIGLVLPEWRADVPTLLDALRLRREPR